MDKIQRTYGKLHHESVNDASYDSDEIKRVPGVFEIALERRIENLRKRCQINNSGRKTMTINS